MVVCLGTLHSMNNPNDFTGMQYWLLISVSIDGWRFI